MVLSAEAYFLSPVEHQVADALMYFLGLHRATFLVVTPGCSRGAQLFLLPTLLLAWRLDGYEVPSFSLGALLLVSVGFFSTVLFPISCVVLLFMPVSITLKLK